MVLVGITRRVSRKHFFRFKKYITQINISLFIYGRNRDRLFIGIGHIYFIGLEMYLPSSNKILCFEYELEAYTYYPSKSSPKVQY